MQALASRLGTVPPRSPGNSLPGSPLLGPSGGSNGTVEGIPEEQTPEMVMERFEKYCATLEPEVPPRTCKGCRPC